MLALDKENKSLLGFALALCALHLLVMELSWSPTASTAGQGPRLPVAVASFGGQARSQSTPTPQAPRPKISQSVSTTVAAPRPTETAVVPSEPAVGAVDGNGFGKGQGQGIGTGVASQARGDLKQMYLNELRARIDDLKRYPLQARRMGQAGVVEVSFTVAADGHIINPRISRASPFKQLNESALEAVAAIRTFRPLPSEFGGQPLDVNVPIRFSLSN